MAGGQAEKFPGADVVLDCLNIQVFATPYMGEDLWDEQSVSWQHLLQLQAL